MANFQYTDKNLHLGTIPTGSIFLFQNPGFDYTGVALNTLATKNLTGYFYSINNPSGFLTTAAGTGLFYTKNNESGFITSAQAGGVQRINNISGTIFITGSGNITVESGAGGLIRVYNQPQMFIGTGNPNGRIQAQSGSLFIDATNFLLYMKISGTSSSSADWV